MDAHKNVGFLFVWGGIWGFSEPTGSVFPRTCLQVRTGSCSPASHKRAKTSSQSKIQRTLICQLFLLPPNPHWLRHDRSRCSHWLIEEHLLLGTCGVKLRMKNLWSSSCWWNSIPHLWRVWLGLMKIIEHHLKRNWQVFYLYVWLLFLIKWCLASFPN